MRTVRARRPGPAAARVAKSCKLASRSQSHACIGLEWSASAEWYSIKFQEKICNNIDDDDNIMSMLCPAENLPYPTAGVYRCPAQFISCMLTPKVSNLVIQILHSPPPPPELVKDVSSHHPIPLLSHNLFQFWPIISPHHNNYYSLSSCACM